jgi:hypothetical protein
MQIPSFRELADPHGATLRVQPDPPTRSVRCRHDLVLDVNALLDPPAILSPGCPCPCLGRGHSVDRDESEVTEQHLVVHAPKGSVVDDCLRSRYQGSEPTEAFHCHSGLGAGPRHPLDVEDDAASLVRGSGCHKYELHSPGRLAISLEVQASVGLMSGVADLAGRPIDLGLERPGSEQRSHDLSVGVQEATGVRPRPRSRARTALGDRRDVLGLWTLGPLDDLKRDAVALPWTQVPGWGLLSFKGARRSLPVPRVSADLGK